VTVAGHIDSFDVADFAMYADQIQVQVATVQLQGIVTGTAVHQMEVNIADLNRVITRTAMEHICPATADQCIVAVTGHYTICGLTALKFICSRCAQSSHRPVKVTAKHHI
jgi:hypothetical protein